MSASLFTKSSYSLVLKVLALELGGRAAECATVPGAPTAPPSPSREKAPKGSRGAQCLPGSTAPGSCLFPGPHSLFERRAPPSSSPSEESRSRRHRSGQQGNVGPRRPGSAAALSTPAADAKKGPPPASRPRAPASRSSRARPRAAEGEGRLRARPLLRRPNFPQLPQLSCALTVRLPGLPRGPSRSSSAPWPRRRTIGGRSLGGSGDGWSKEQARRSRPSPSA